MKHTNRLALVLLAALALASCSERDLPAEDTDRIEPAATTAAETTSAPETEIPTQPAVPEADDTPRFISNAGNLKLQSVEMNAEDYRIHPLGEDRYVIVLFNRLRDKDGNLWIENSQSVCTNIRAVIFDAKTGEMGKAIPIGGSTVPQNISYTDKGCILYNFVNYGNGVTQTAAWELDLTAKTPALKAVKFDPAKERGRAVTSPDGKWTAYRQTVDLSGDGEIILRGSDGKTKVILEGISLDEAEKLAGNEQAIGKVEGYSAVGFLDNERLVYNITGWEWSIGWGIYNVKTGEKTEYRSGDHISSIYDGKLYGTDFSYAALDSVYRFAADGTKTVLADKTTGIFAPMTSAPEIWMFGMQNGRWSGVPYVGTDVGLGNLYIYDAEMKNLLAEVSGKADQWIIGGDTVYFLHRTK